MPVSGWGVATWELYKASMHRESLMLEKSLTLSRPGPIKQKPFIPKNDLPRLDDYSVDPPDS